MHAYMYLCIYVSTHIHTYIHTFIHTYIHTHIHTYTWPCICNLAGIMAPKLENRVLTRGEAAKSKAKAKAKAWASMPIERTQPPEEYWNRGPANVYRTVPGFEDQCRAMAVASQCLLGAGLPRKIVARIMVDAGSEPVWGARRQ